MRKNEIRTIVIIGAGNVATNLASALKGVTEIKAVWSRTISHAEDLCLRTGIGDLATDSLETLPDADLYLISVPDHAYSGIYNILPSLPGIIANTSGTAPVPHIPGHTCGTGVFYPMQTFRKERTADFHDIPVLIEGDSAHTISSLHNLAAKISTKVIDITDNQTKSKIHLAAVFASNFSNYLWGLSDELMRQCGGDLSFLENLIRENLDNALKLGCSRSQTGPAMRGDRNVLEKHLGIIASSALPHPSTEEIYTLLSETIYKKYNTVKNEQDKL